MAEKDYSHRDVVDKLGIKPGHAVAFVEDGWAIDGDLRQRVLDRAARTAADAAEPVDSVLLSASDSTDVTALLRSWKVRLDPAGGIWVLTRKRGQPGYLDQTQLIGLGLAAGLVDNKVCSVSDAVSAMRFVIRKADRAAKR